MILFICGALSVFLILGVVGLYVDRRKNKSIMVFKSEPRRVVIHNHNNVGPNSIETTDEKVIAVLRRG